MELSDVKNLIDDGKIKYITLGIPDTNGIFRRKHFTGQHFLSSLARGIPFSNAIFCCDLADSWIYPFKMGNINQRLGDSVMMPDLTTFMVVPWEEQRATCISDLWTTQGAPVTISSRYVLRKLVERARDLGFEPMAAPELEIRFFREDGVSLRKKDFGPDLAPLHPLSKIYGSSADDHLITEIVSIMQDYGMNVECYLTEHAPGMYEVNTTYADALTAADHAMLFKAGVKEIASQKGFTASFMSRWHEHEDGSSGHVHMSLWDRDRERNLFWDADAEGGISSTMRHFLAGLLSALPDFMAIYAPLTNSYKRHLVNLPIRVPLCTTWGIDNRSCAVRVLNTERRAIRIENRVPGADANFYLVFAAMIASGLDGIERKLEIPAPLKGNAHQLATIEQALMSGDIRSLAPNLTVATDMLARSSIAREYFGSDFIEHFVVTRRWEVQQYEQAVTNWERRRYLELI